MWVRYCRPPIGAHFHPNSQPPPVPQQLREKAHLRIACSVGDFMLLFARWQPTAWRGEFASLRPLLGGRTRLVIIIIIVDVQLSV